MSQLSVMIVRADDLANPATLLSGWPRPLPAVTLEGLEPACYLDGLESTVAQVGWEMRRSLLVEQWRLTDQALVRRYCEENGATEVITGDGYDLLKVARRFGVVPLPRQVCYRTGEAHHTLPGNAGLPPHEGQVTPRGLQEWVPRVAAGHVLWYRPALVGLGHPRLGAISETQVRRWVCHHGQLIRQAEQAETEALLNDPDLT